VLVLCGSGRLCYRGKLVGVVVLVAVIAAGTFMQGITASVYGRSHDSILVVMTQSVFVRVLIAVAAAAGVNGITLFCTGGGNDGFGVAVLMLCGSGGICFAGELVGVVVFVAVTAALALMQGVSALVNSGFNNGYLVIVPQRIFVGSGIAVTATAGIFGVTLFRAGGINHSLAVIVRVLGGLGLCFRRLRGSDDRHWRLGGNSCRLRGSDSRFRRNGGFHGRSCGRFRGNGGWR
jgi:hypothetical protein